MVTASVQVAIETTWLYASHIDTLVCMINTWGYVYDRITTNCTDSVLIYGSLK